MMGPRHDGTANCGQPQDEEDRGLVHLELQVQQEQESEKALQDREENFVALVRVEDQRAQFACADHEE